jgi:hypothetical protein
MITIKCPKCGTEGSLSLVQPIYEGPYRCWKCKELFSIKIAGNKLESCEPLSQEEFERRQQIEAQKAKFKKPQD